MPSLTSNLYEFREFRLDLQQRILRKAGETVALTPKALDVLVLLVQRSGEVVSKDELMTTVWPDSFVEESNLTQTVFMLRKALGETPEQRYILTVQGRGYRFLAEVRQSSEDRSSKLQSPAVESGAGIESQPADGSSHAVPQAVVRATSAPPRLLPKSRPNWLLAIGIFVVLLISALLALRWSRSQKPAADPQRRVLLAVLPFQNLTGDPAQEYFSDGLTEEMITQLGNLDPQHMGVIARTSIMHYKNNPAPLDQVVRELGVEYILEGSVRRESENVRVAAQLIHATDQTHVWARQYDRKLTGLLSLQGEIAQEIADEIQLALGDRKSAAASRPELPSHNYEAYDLFLKGQYFLNKRTAPDLEQAIAYFQQATAKDPGYARAYAGIAASYTLLPGYTGRPPADVIPKARVAALKALQVDDNLAEAHTALALIVQTFDWDWQTAEKEFQRAIQLNPNYATAHHWYAEHLMWRGRFDEALQESERARQLDPLSLIIAADNGAILYYSRRYDAAIEKWRSVLEMDPDFLRAHLIIGAYTEKGMYAAALAENDRLREKIAPPVYWALQAYIHGQAQQPAEAGRALHQVLKLNLSRPADPVVVSWAYLGIGDTPRALAFLEKGYVEHSNELTALGVSPLYDPLRTNPQFQDLLHRLKLAK